MPAAVSGVGRIPARDCFLQLYTSGTTGYPKGAMLTHRSIAAHSRAADPASVSTAAR